MSLIREPGALAPYQQIRQILREEILHEMSAGDRIAPERELAKRFGANRATINRAIASLVKDGLLVRQVGRGTFVAGGVSGGIKTKTHTIGVVLPYIQGDFPGHIIRSAIRELRKLNYKAVLFDSDRSVITEAAEIDRLIKESPDGAIIMPLETDENNALFNRLMRLMFPVIFIDRKPPEIEGDCVSSDNFWGAYQGTMRLIERGHTRIAHFTWLEDHQSTSVIQRRLGYEQAMIDSGIGVDPELICPPAAFPDMSSVLKHGISYLRMGDKPITAAFALNDYFAIATIAACQALGLRIPQDIELAAYFDGEFPPLSPDIKFIKIVQLQEEIGKAAIDMLMKRIEGIAPEGPQDVMIRPEIRDELSGQIDPVVARQNTKHG